MHVSLVQRSQVPKPCDLIQATVKTITPHTDARQKLFPHVVLHAPISNRLAMVEQEPLGHEVPAWVEFWKSSMRLINASTPAPLLSGEEIWQSSVKASLSKAVRSAEDTSDHAFEYLSHTASVDIISP